MLKIGDRVKLIRHIYRDEPNNPLWKGYYGKIKGTVTLIRKNASHFCYEVKWRNGTYNEYRKGDLSKLNKQYNLFGEEI